MNQVDSYRNSRSEMKNIRAIELRFDKVIRNDNTFTLIQDGIHIAIIYRHSLTEKTVIKLDALAGME